MQRRMQWAACDLPLLVKGLLPFGLIQSLHYLGGASIKRVKDIRNDNVRNSAQHSLKQRRQPLGRLRRRQPPHAPKCPTIRRLHRPICTNTLGPKRNPSPKDIYIKGPSRQKPPKPNLKMCNSGSSALCCHRLEQPVAKPAL